MYRVMTPNCAEQKKASSFVPYEKAHRRINRK